MLMTGDWLESAFGWVSNPFWLITFAILVAVIRFLDVLSYPEKPKVVYLAKLDSVKDGCSIGEVLERCPILNKVYLPPIFWGRSGHLQTASYGLFGHTSLKRLFNKRYVIRQSDGASVVFDVFEPVKRHESGRDYTLVLCPGIANTSESNYIRTLVHCAQEKGYRCAVLNHLGALKHVPLTSNRIFSYGGYAELESMIDSLIELYSSTRFFCIGFSMGANITTRLLAHMPSAKLDKVVLGMSVAQGYSAINSASLYLQWEKGRRFYSYVITENMKRLLRRNHDMAVMPYIKSGVVDEQRLWSATSISSFDDAYSRRVSGYKSIEDFYADMSSLPLIPTIKVPMIFVNAIDDPLIPPCLWQPVQELAEKNAHFGFVLTKHGGHLGFLEGSCWSPNSVTWLDRFVLEVADAATIVSDGNTN